LSIPSMVNHSTSASLIPFTPLVQNAIPSVHPVDLNLNCLK
jgi:hypothetical protein